MKKGTMKKWIALLCTVLLSISLFAIPAFAAEADAASKKLSTGTIIGIIIAVVVVVAAVVLGIKFRENIKKFLRVYKSESKKIVWLSWDQTKKSTWVVLIVLVLCALAICLIDFGLSKGFLAFIDLFKQA